MKALLIENLKKTYSDGTEALKGINLSVEDGEFMGLLGPNGAGKSTTIGIISSLIKKTSGKIHIYDLDTDTSLNESKIFLGVMPQEYNFSIFETVLTTLVRQAGYFGIRKKIALDRAEQYLHEVELWEKRYTQVRFLSGGMKRRLMIARALINQPRILILDEPTAGVDIELKYNLWKLLEKINRQGTTVILTTHYLEEAESLCNRIAIINNGEIVADAPTKVLIGKLDLETYILDLEKPIINLEAIEGVTFKKIDDTTIEAIVSRSLGINRLFAILNEKNISVVSLKNKMNRLEEMFLHLTGNKNNSEDEHV